MVYILGLSLASTSFAGLQTQKLQRGLQQVDVIRVDDLTQLKMYLNHAQGPYASFTALRKTLAACTELKFAMNAGMYHADLSPVGLYIENVKQHKTLNQAQGKGNFFMQPNGVLMWNQKQAQIVTTQAYNKTPFKADYATQSGPMLVIDGQINSQFIAHSDSRKIRNGVGVKNNQLYFVISRNRINFYDFAQFFQKELGIQQALYLDGSISSLYYPPLKRHDQHAVLGPILAVTDQRPCNK